MAYSDAERTEALIRLALNRYDYVRTAGETGISRHQLKRWHHGKRRDEKKMVPVLLERALERILMAVPENMPAMVWAEAVSLLMAQWVQLQNAGIGTGLGNNASILSKISEADDAEFNAILAEAERILGSEEKGSDPSGNDEEEGSPSSNATEGLSRIT